MLMVKTVIQYTLFLSKDRASIYELDQTPESLILRPLVHDCSPMMLADVRISIQIKDNILSVLL